MPRTPPRSGATRWNSPSSSRKSPYGTARLGVHGRAGRVQPHDRAHRVPVREHHARRPEAVARARPGPGAPDRHGRVRGRVGRHVAEVRVGPLREVPTPAEVEEDGRGHDRHDALTHREAEPVLLHPTHHAGRRVQPVGASPAQHDRVHLGDQAARRQEVRLARSRGAALHVDAGRRASLGADDRGAGPVAALDALIAADLDAGHVGEGVRGARLLPGEGGGDQPEDHREGARDPGRGGGESRAAEGKSDDRHVRLPSCEAARDPRFVYPESAGRQRVGEGA